jgi:hypothetical protein
MGLMLDALRQIEAQTPTAVIVSLPAAEEPHQGTVQSFAGTTAPPWSTTS